MNILLVGAGGYGVKYVDYLLEGVDPTLTLVGVVEPYYAGCARKDAIDAAGIPVYETMEAFYATQRAELAVICTPPFLHATQSIFALEHGSFVLCEKPVSPTPAEAERMAEAERALGKWIAVGYQWSFSRAIQALKRDILAGCLGKPRLLKTIVSWPRKKSYYGRGVGWAGKMQKGGITVWDSIASNACAHYLHNMLFLLGGRMSDAALPHRVEAECLRAYDIETFDTCVLRMDMGEGAVAYFIASHAADEKQDPQFVYEFERGSVRYTDGQIVAELVGGERIFYGDPFENEMGKISDCARCVENGTVPVCTVQTAAAHTFLMEGLHTRLSVGAFPAETVRENEERIWVDGLCAAMRDCYGRTEMLSEAGMHTSKVCFEIKGNAIHGLR